MIFTDVIFLVAILLPFVAFSIIDRGLSLPFALRFGFIVVLSCIYYWYGPSASPTWLAIYVIGNFVLLRVIDDRMQLLITLAVANIVALFIIKAVRPGGAPLGISFHAFQIVGLLIACVQRPGIPVPAYSYFLLLTFFPQLAAGPVVHWNRVHRFFERWRANTVVFIKLDWILLFLAIGFAKKLFIADMLYPAVHKFQNGAEFSGADSLVFPLLYSVYLYMDFSAYSDIATGLALMIGMQMPINFYSPYKSPNPRVFWRRWHRTLYKFLRNDMYFLYRRFGLPTGTAFLAFIFLFSGYWHGAAWGYMLWAAGHFFYFRFYPYRLMSRTPLVVQVVSNFVAVSLLWLPFALGGAGLIRWFEGLATTVRTFASFNGNVLEAIQLTSSQITVTAIGLVIVLLMPAGFEMARDGRFWTLKRAMATILLVLSLHQIFGAPSGSPAFVYFQF